jgi:hypothetical protein
MPKLTLSNWQQGDEEKYRFMNGRESMLYILINKEGE